MSLSKTTKQNLEVLIEVNGNFKKTLNNAFDKLLKLRERANTPAKIVNDVESTIEDQYRLYSEIVKVSEKLITKFKLTSFYKDGIIQYLFDKKFGDQERWVKYKYLPIEVNDPINPKKKILAIPLYPESNITDIQKYWKGISQARENEYKKRNIKTTTKVTTRKNHQRDLEIYKLKKEGGTAKDIVEVINSKYPDSKIEYAYVSKVIIRLNKLAKELIGDK